MKNLYNTIALAGANLFALGTNAAPVTQSQSALSVDTGANKTQSMSDGQLRAIEASHLQVYRGCKWGHAAFDPIKVESEELSNEVLSLHSQMDIA